MELTKKEKDFYESRMKYLKRQIKQVEKDIFLDEDTKKLKLALLNEQIELLKHDFISRLAPRIKYNRNLQKQQNRKEIEESDKDDYMNFRI